MKLRLRGQKDIVMDDVDAEQTGRWRTLCLKKQMTVPELVT